MDETQKISGRLISLDVFRGLTIAGMILVNNPGTWSKIYEPLKHAAWHGCTPTDLIFPFFLFIVGVSITLSLTKRKEQAGSKKDLYIHIFRRGIILIVLGLILSTPMDFFVKSDKTFWEIIVGWRIPGVLQRIGLVYIIAAILFLTLNVRKIVITTIIILFTYNLILALVPVPTIGKASFGPVVVEKQNENIVYVDDNLPAYIDRLILGKNIWIKDKYDPEGLLSSLPAIATVLIGILVGIWMREKVEIGEKISWLFTVGYLLTVAGYIWSAWFPINKPIWTSSYVLYTGGLGILFLATCYWLIDAKKYDGWTKPFLVYGSNAITVFFASGVLARILTIVKVEGGNAAGLLFENGLHKVLAQEITLKDYLFANLFLSWLSPINASLAFALAYVLIWLGLMWILYAKKIFIKI